MRKFTVYARGTLCGAFEAETADEALQRCADERGTAAVGERQASTKGMTAVTGDKTIKPPRKSKRKKPVYPRERFTDRKWEQTAIEYVRWLAKRDGVALPENHWRNQPRAMWSGVYSKTRKRAGGHPIFERRIQCVEWGHEEEVFNTRKDGKRGAWLYNKWVCEVRFTLPNWDFQPDLIEVSADDALLAA
jgi:hypothetical protein